MLTNDGEPQEGIVKGRTAHDPVRVLELEHDVGLISDGEHPADAKCCRCDGHRAQARERVERAQWRADVAAGRCHFDLGRGFVARTGGCPHDS